MSRTKEQVNQDYGQLCAQIGERTFQIAIMQEDIKVLQAKIVEVGKEMQSINQGEKTNESKESTAS